MATFTACDQCGETEGVREIDDSFLCQECAPSETEQDDSGTDGEEQASEEESAYETEDSDSSDSESEMDVDDDESEDEDSENEVTIDGEGVRTLQRRAAGQKAIRQWYNYIINPINLDTMDKNKVETSTAMDDFAQALDGDLASLAPFYMAKSTAWANSSPNTHVVWNLIAAFLAPSSPGMPNENDPQRQKRISDLQYWTKVWKPVIDGTKSLFRPNVVYFWTTDGVSTGMRLRNDGAALKSTIRLPTGVNFTFKDGTDNLGRADFRTYFSYGKEAMDSLARSPPPTVLAAAHMVYLDVEGVDDALVEAAEHIKTAAQKTMAILHFSSLVFREYLRRFELQRSPERALHHYGFIGKKKRERWEQIRVRLSLPGGVRVMFNVDPTEGQYCTLHEVFKTIVNDMGKYQLPLPFGTTRDGWVNWDTLRTTCIHRTAPFGGNGDDYSFFNRFEKGRRFGRHTDLYITVVDDAPRGRVTVQNTKGWKTGNEISTLVPVTTLLGDVRVHRRRLREFPADEVSGLPLDTPVHALDDRTIRLQTGRLRLENRIPCSEEARRAHILDTVRQYLGKARASLPTVATTNRGKTIVVRADGDQEGHRRALFVDICVAYMEGRGGRVFYSGIDFGDLRRRGYHNYLEGFDCRKYTCREDDFEAVIRSHPQYRDDWAELFRVVPYQSAGENQNDTVETYFDHMARAFSMCNFYQAKGRNRTVLREGDSVFQWNGSGNLDRSMVGRNVRVLSFFPTIEDQHGHRYDLTTLPNHPLRSNDAVPAYFPKALEVCLYNDADFARHGGSRAEKKKGWLLMDFENQRFFLDGAKVSSYTKCRRLLRYLVLKQTAYPDADLMGCFVPPGDVSLPVSPLRSTAFFTEGVDGSNYVWDWGGNNIGGLEFGCIHGIGTLRSQNTRYVNGSYVDRPLRENTRRLLKKAMEAWAEKEYAEHKAKNQRIRKERKRRREDGESVTTETEETVEDFARKRFCRRANPNEPREGEHTIIVVD